MERRIAVAALAGVMLCAQGIFSPCAASAAEAPTAAVEDAGKALPKDDFKGSYIDAA